MSGTLIDKLSFLKGGAEERGESREERLMQLLPKSRRPQKSVRDLGAFHCCATGSSSKNGATIRIQEQMMRSGTFAGRSKTGFGALVSSSFAPVEDLPSAALGVRRRFDAATEARETRQAQTEMSRLEEHAGWPMRSALLARQAPPAGAQRRLRSAAGRSDA